VKITTALKAGKKVGFASYIRYNPRAFEAAASLAAIEIRTSIGKFQQDACSGRQASTGVYLGLFSVDRAIGHESR
jgi:hypothetical protein